MRIFKIFRILMRVRMAIPRVIPLMRDARVPLQLKLIACGLALLAISPLNVLGDIPVIGWFDDGAILTMILMWFVGSAEKGLMKRVNPGSALVRYPE